MKVELSQEEYVLIQDALNEWSGSPIKTALMTSVIGLSLVPPHQHEKARKDGDLAIDKAQQEVGARRERATLLMAKIITARDAAAVEEVSSQ